MLVRVYQPVSGPARVVYPNWRHLGRDESHAACLARCCARAERADASLAGLPFIDVDHQDLPDRASRDRWRVRGTRVVLAEADHE